MMKKRNHSCQAFGVLLSLQLSLFHLASPVVPRNGVAQINLKEIRVSEETRASNVIKYQSGRFVVTHFYQTRSAPPEWVAVLGPDGAEEFRCTPAFSLPDYRYVAIDDAAVNKKGILAVSILVISSSGLRSSMIAIYDTHLKSERALRVVPVFPISVSYIVVDEQNSVWLLGPNMQAQGAGQDYSCVHKLSADGQLVGSYVPRSTLPLLSDDGRRIEPWFYAPAKPGWPRLFAGGSGRIYAWFPAMLTVLGLESDGAIVSQTKLDPSGLGNWSSVAVQPNGAVLAILANGLNEFDQGSGKWHPVVEPSDPSRIAASGVAADTLSSLSQTHYLMIGADDSDVVVRNRTERMLSRVRFRMPSQPE
jgi:hypothetical protein